MCGGERGEDTMEPLNLTVLIFHGNSASRRRLGVREACPSSRVDFVKEKVRASLKDVPDEVMLMAGEDVMDDSQVLSDYDIGGSKGVLAIVWYMNAYTEWQWEEPWAGDDGEALPCEQMMGDTMKDFQDFQSLCFQEETVTIPEAPMVVATRRQIRRKSIARTLTWTSEEKRLSESGDLMKLDLTCRIIEGKRWKQRKISIPVAPHATVGEIEKRLTEWLGSVPDELVLTHGDVVLESRAKLDECQAGAAPELGVLAWYMQA